MRREFNIARRNLARQLYNPGEIGVVSRTTRRKKTLRRLTRIPGTIPKREGGGRVLMV